MPIPVEESVSPGAAVAKMGLQAAGAFARNPKALVAVVKYQLAQRKAAKEAS